MRPAKSGGIPLLLLIFLVSGALSEDGAQDAANRQPVHIAIVSSFSPVLSEKSENILSLNVFFGSTRRVTGLQLGAGISAVDRWSKGIQVSGIGSIGGESWTGFQAGGIFTRLSGSLLGVQLSPGLNWVQDHVLGLQLGGLNLVRGDVLGLQAAVIANSARDVYGGQIGLINIAHDVHGFQAGLINIARSVSGISLGFINLVDDGYCGLQVWFDSRQFANIGIQYGGSLMYTVLQTGTSASPEKGPATVVAGYGVGVHFRAGPLFLDTDLSAKTWVPVIRGAATEISTLRQHIYPSLRMTVGGGNDHFAIYGGITLDALSEHSDSLPGPRAGSRGFGVEFLPAGTELFPACFLGIRV